jgi:hypothetical protein
MLDTHAKPNHRLRVLSSSTGVPLPFPGTIILRCRPKIQVTGHRRQRALAANPAPEKATFHETESRAAARSMEPKLAAFAIFLLHNPAGQFPLPSEVAQ